MSLAFQVLGGPGQDNALLVRIDSGQSIERLLFDCGEACLSGLPFSEIKEIDHLFFSHLHMDHVAGFDSYFRANYGRDSKPNHIWGPPDTSRILQHRFQGFLWNLHDQMNATWRVSDVSDDRVETARFELREAFAQRHEEAAMVRSGVLVAGGNYVLEAVTMNHKTPTLAYVVRENPRQNIDMARLSALGLKPGPWLKQLKEAVDPSAVLMVDGVPHSVRNLREALVVETPGDSIAYLTDFLLDQETIGPLVESLQGVRRLVCEGQYRHADAELAHRNFHMTTVLSATLAKQAGVDELVLIHLSDRYPRQEWLDMLAEARAVFPATRFPDGWLADTSSLTSA